MLCILPVADADELGVFFFLAIFWILVLQIVDGNFTNLLGSNRIESLVQRVAASAGRDLLVDGAALVAF